MYTYNTKTPSSILFRYREVQVKVKCNYLPSNLIDTKYGLQPCPGKILQEHKIRKILSYLCNWFYQYDLISCTHSEQYTIFNIKTSSLQVPTKWQGRPVGTDLLNYNYSKIVILLCVAHFQCEFTSHSSHYHLHLQDQSPKSQYLTKKLPSPCRLMRKIHQSGGDVARNKSGVNAFYAAYIHRYLLTSQSIACRDIIKVHHCVLGCTRLVVNQIRKSCSK